MAGFFDILRLNCKLLLIFPSWNKSQGNKSVRLTLFSWQLYHNDTLSRTWNNFFLNVKCNFDRSKVTWKTGTKMFDKQYKFTVISTFMVYSWNGYRGWYTRIHTLYSAKNILLAFDEIIIKSNDLTHVWIDNLVLDLFNEIEIISGS